jgi:hypothetical protein
LYELEGGLGRYTGGEVMTVLRSTSKIKPLLVRCSALLGFGLISFLVFSKKTLPPPYIVDGMLSNASGQHDGNGMQTKFKTMFHFISKENHHVPGHACKYQQNQQVVVLAGPHKTGSSSIQYNLMRLFADKNDTLGLQERWSFDSPIKTFREEGCIHAKLYPYQVFYWLIQAMQRSKKAVCNSNQSTEEIIHDPDQMIQLYSQGFEESWSRNKSIIIATEAIDVANSIRYDGSQNEFLLKFLKLLPSASAGNVVSKKVTAVIMYRSPRIEHLQSMWIEHAKATKEKNLTFSAYLIKLGSNTGMLNPLDSFNLAKQCLLVGMRVILIDMSGLKRVGKDVSQVVACKIIGGKCQNYARIIDAAARLNVGNQTQIYKNMDLRRIDLIKIDKAIKSHDCEMYTEISSNKNFVVLYPFDLELFFVQCKTRQKWQSSSTVFQSRLHCARSDLVAKIKDVTRDLTSKKSDSRDSFRSSQKYVK